MATANAAESKEQRCGYCLERRSHMEDPSELPCSHVFCLPCLCDGRDLGGIVCPICRCQCAIDDLKHLNEKFSGPRAILEDNIACGSCKTEVKESAVIFCGQCDKTFCTKHEESHDDLFDLEHDKIPIANFIKSKNKYQKLKCAKHKTKNVTLGCDRCYKLFCVSCDLNVICSGVWEPAEHEKVVNGHSKSTDEAGRKPEAVEGHCTGVSLSKAASNPTATSTVVTSNTTEHRSTPAPSQNHGLFGSKPAPSQNHSVFGSTPAPSQNHGLFGSKPAPSQNHSVFGSTPAPSQNHGLFGSKLVPSQNHGLFGSQPAPSQNHGLFGSKPAQSQNHGLFGSTPPVHCQGKGLFGSKPAPSQNHGLFGSNSAQSQNHSLFGSKPAQSQNHGLFGSTSPAHCQGKGLFRPMPSTSSHNQGLFGLTPISHSPDQGIFESTPKPSFPKPASSEFGIFPTPLDSLFEGQIVVTEMPATWSTTPSIARNPFKEESKHHRLLPVAEFNEIFRSTVETSITKLATKQTEAFRLEKKAWKEVEEVENHAEVLKSQVDRFIQLECQKIQQNAKEFKQSIDKKTKEGINLTASQCEKSESQIKSLKDLEDRLSSQLTKNVSVDTIDTFHQLNVDIEDALKINFMYKPVNKLGVSLSNKGGLQFRITQYKPNSLLFLREKEMDTCVASMTWTENGTLIMLVEGNTIQAMDSDLNMLRATTVDSEVLDITPFSNSFITLQQVGSQAHIYQHSAPTLQTAELILKQELSSTISSIATSKDCLYIGMLLSKQLLLYSLIHKTTKTFQLLPEILGDQLVHVNGASFMISHKSDSPALLHVPSIELYDIDIGNMQANAPSIGLHTDDEWEDRTKIQEAKTVKYTTEASNKSTDVQNSKSISDCHQKIRSTTLKNKFSKTKDSCGFLYTFNAKHQMIAVGNEKGECVATLEHEKLLECAEVTGVAVTRDLLAVSSADGKIILFKIV